MLLSRRNRGWVGNWWMTIDRTTLFMLAAMLIVGLVMVTAASPAVAKRIGLDPFYFVHRHLVNMFLALLVMFAISSCSKQWVRRFAFIGMLGGFLLMGFVLLLGMEAKGATRWIYILGFSLQPSEFVKPFFAVSTAWFLAMKHENTQFPSYRLACITFAVFVLLLLMQPDFGMTLTVSFVWVGQLFLAGLSVYLLPILVIIGCVSIIGAYVFFPHVARRIDGFLDPSASDNYQVSRSLEAIKQGGFLGKGPGEGTVKQHLPDSHTDFIFAVIGEELGVIACIVVVCLFALLVFRVLHRLRQEKDVFVLYAVAAIMMQLATQAIINMGVAVQLLPAKGMTLPFISYGGSSLIAISMAMGMVLALTRKRFGNLPYNPN